jgi:hypothetical protein
LRKAHGPRGLGRIDLAVLVRQALCFQRHPHALREGAEMVSQWEQGAGHAGHAYQ